MSIRYRPNEPSNGEEVSTLPRKQQDRIIETVSALVAQYKQRA